MAPFVRWRPAAGPIGEHPRIVILGGDGPTNDEIRAACGTGRWEASSCDGPVAGHSCPIAEGGVCPIVEDADLVVNGLDGSDRRVTALLEALVERHPGLPVVGVGDR